MARTLATAINPPTPETCDTVALGRAIRAQRLSSGLRIDDAAALCGVSVAVLSRLENGGAGVSMGRVFKILDSLGLTLLVVDKPKVPQIMAALKGPGQV